ncbi:hypothetical protein lbkm_1450 [Lachnospiraceae bacterium KM106-2]|nr:hypothetical protein lbkm_1450 [Lachnospiraceae bacterium KM106-2]
MNIIFLLLIALAGLVAIFSCAILAFGIPAIIGWKLYRKIRYGISMYD